ncbi:MAG: glycosyltransferase family protein, partial [Desulfovibrionaceae bacterium]
HIRRTLAIASHLKGRAANILILTGSPLVGRFDFPKRVDFVRIPGMIKHSNDLYLPHSIRIDPKKALRIRRSIITATAKSFMPDLFIVDKAPLGLKREIMPTLKWMRSQSPRIRTVLGLRDIMDDADSTRKDWSDKGVYRVMSKYYSEIWVYGHQELYDPVQEYDIPDEITAKMIFTGYIPRKTWGADTKPKRSKAPSRSNKLVVATAGGGGDGYPLMDALLKAMEAESRPPFRAVLVSGPFMLPEERRDLAARAKKVGAPFFHFYRRMERLLGAADLVVSMGGYNTICEILSHRKPSLILPRETPRMEQRIRAEMLKREGVADLLPFSDLSPENLLEKITAMLENPQIYQQAIDAFRFTGLEVMRKRIKAFQNSSCK